MITSAVLTAMFAVTGGWAAVRLAQVATRRGPAADVVAELTHLAMSVAMIAMAWGVVAGPDDVGGVTTLVVFALVAAWAVVRMTRPAARFPRALTGHHLLMATAMIWMVAAMPRLMGGSDAGSPAHAVPGMPLMAGMPGTPGVPPGPSAWVTASTWLLVPALGLAAAVWVLRGLRSGSGGTAPAGPDHGAVVTGPGTVAVLASPPAPALVGGCGVCRLDACCHALMSGGMAAMILAMM